MHVSTDRDTLTRHISGVSNVVFAQNAASAKPKLFAEQSRLQKNFPAQKFLGARATVTIQVKLSAKVFSNQKAADELKWACLKIGVNLNKQTNMLRMA